MPPKPCVSSTIDIDVCLDEISVYADIWGILYGDGTTACKYPCSVTNDAHAFPGYILQYEGLYTLKDEQDKLVTNPGTRVRLTRPEHSSMDSRKKRFYTKVVADMKTPLCALIKRHFTQVTFPEDQTEYVEQILSSIVTEDSIGRKLKAKSPLIMEQLYEEIETHYPLGIHDLAQLDRLFQRPLVFRFSFDRDDLAESISRENKAADFFAGMKFPVRVQRPVAETVVQ